MPSTAIDRRQSLAWLAAGLLAPTLAHARSGLSAKPGIRPLFLSARAQPRDRYFITGFGDDGELRFDRALSGRGHAIAVNPERREAVVFARRPGTFALVLVVDGGQVVETLACGDGRHFGGHGVFSADGRTLFSTENDFDNGRGVIGIRDATDRYRQIGEYPSHEIGPHDIGLLADGATLAVANGGILTHPDSGRAKLNIPEMSPSLAYVDIANGALRDNFRLPPAFHKLGIRHLAIGPDDRVALALQYEGGRGDMVPLVGVHDGGAEIALISAPDAVLRGMHGYCGGCAIDRSGTILGVSNPRGHRATFWDLRERRYLDEVAITDGCGIAATDRPAEFLVTGGYGSICRFDPVRRAKSAVDIERVGETMWDNHLTAVI